MLYFPCVALVKLASVWVMQIKFLNLEVTLRSISTHSNTVIKQGLCNTDRQYASQWRHNGRDGVSNHPRPDYLLNRLFKRRSKKTSKLRLTGLCEGNLPVTNEFPSQRVNKQRVLMHRHQGWNVRHGLCHIYMRYLYIYELFIAFVCFVVCSLL